MSEAKHCPHCGAPLDASAETNPIEASEAATEPEPPPVESLDPEGPDFTPPLLAPGSTDETFLSTAFGEKVAATEPDPILGAFTAVGSAVASDTARGGDSEHRPKSSSVSSPSFPMVQFDPTPKPAAVPPSDHPLTAVASPRIAPSAGEDEEEDDDEPEESRTGWSRVLLASYASAVTLGLVWFVMKDRALESSRPAVAPARAEKTQSPITGNLSKTVQPPEPILGEHFAKLGKPIKIGSLEITPLDVKRQGIKLQRTNLIASPEFREEGKKALVLRLKLKNLSNDAVFAPLDPAYLREGGEKRVDTFVTTADGEIVYPYRLAMESEWSIVGQDLKELRPGESKIVAIATAADAPPDEAGPFTWRIRLRTGIDRTDLIGLVWPAPRDESTPVGPTRSEK